MNKDEMIAVQNAIGDNDVMTVHGIVAPILELNPNDVDALFIRATYSVGDETDDEFDARVLSMMNRACDLGYAPAQYQVADWLREGDVMPLDCLRAAQLFKLASEVKYPPAMYEHGLNLYDGLNGIKKDVAGGMSLIIAAFEYGDEDAGDWMDEHGL